MYEDGAWMSARWGMRKESWTSTRRPHAKPVGSVRTSFVVVVVTVVVVVGSVIGIGISISIGIEKVNVAADCGVQVLLQVNLKLL